jgi:8-oxo-dGTP pyrophosphatase MutT (NUDIX family)
MPGSSILPVSIHNNKLYFLFGKENPLEKSAPGFSDFGGGMEKGETAFETAVREGSEELTGFLGSPTQIRAHIKKTGGAYAFTHTNAKNSAQNYTVHVVRYPYDPELPTHYNNNHRFLWEKMSHQLLSSTKLFEKIEIEWFCEDELKKRMSEYRPFYREVVETLLQKLTQIRKFAEKSQKTKTRRSRNGKRPSASRKIRKKMKGG